jgi:hypothetical protein
MLNRIELAPILFDQTIPPNRNTHRHAPQRVHLGTSGSRKPRFSSIANHQRSSVVTAAAQVSSLPLFARARRDDAEHHRGTRLFARTLNQRGTQIGDVSWQRQKGD